MESDRAVISREISIEEDEDRKHLGIVVITESGMIEIWTPQGIVYRESLELHALKVVTLTLY